MSPCLRQYPPSPSLFHLSQVSSIYPTLPSASNAHSSPLFSEEEWMSIKPGTSAQPSLKRRHPGTVGVMGEDLKRPRLASCTEEVGISGGTSLSRKRPSSNAEEEQFYTSLSEPVKRPRIGEQSHVGRLDGIRMKLWDITPARLYKVP